MAGGPNVFTVADGSRILLCDGPRGRFRLRQGGLGRVLTRRGLDRLDIELYDEIEGEDGTVDLVFAALLQLARP